MEGEGMEGEKRRKVKSEGGRERVEDEWMTE